MRSIKSLFLYLITLLFCCTIKAEIIETAQLDPIAAALKKLDENGLVFLDVDGVIFMPTDQVRRFPKGLEYYHKRIEALRASDPKRASFYISIILLQEISTVVDPALISLVQQLQKRGIKIIALTAAATKQFGFIDDMNAWRADQIQQFGLDFRQTFPNAPVLSFDEFQNTPYTPIFKEGILASGKVSKGEVALAFIKKMGLQPSAIVFIDDRLDYIQKFEQVFDKTNIPHTSFCYTASYLIPNDFDQQVAEMQFEMLFKKALWISDAEAKQLLEQRCGAPPQIPPKEA